ncbi:hypothetical protein FHS18_001706 [Paenibacillus phyllosphaerae]|uniref:Lipoprotein n=1 Tax=Paenibacillus phyllosphaerae TaxID=274593 RepID=A0A7W5AVU8_9BACL|nr:hypothetical protein [Paenibacillus phyllosphaerae]MBB3109643.1 hypothetical protein [Paenibacillus phyllosphaerae]
MDSRRRRIATGAVLLAFIVFIGCGPKNELGKELSVALPDQAAGSSVAETPAQTAANGTPPAQPADEPPQDREDLFPGGVSYYEGSDRMDSLESGNTPAYFKKDTMRPYGFYIPETMKEIKQEEGLAWGKEDPKVELSLLDADKVPSEISYSSYINPLLSKYHEYVGTERGEDGIYTDYILLTDHGRSFAIRLRYPGEDQAAELPDLLASARSLRYVADPAAFQPGMEIEFPQGENEEESDIYQLVEECLRAIASSDKTAFRKTLQTPHADYYDYLLEHEGSYRFTKLEYPISYPRDTARADVGIEYELLKDGIVRQAGYTISLLKDKEGRWYIATID